VLSIEVVCERGVARRLLAKFRGLPAFSARRVLRLRAQRAFRNAAGLHGRWRTAGRRLQPRLESDDMSRRQHRSQVLNARHCAHARHGAQRQHRSQVPSAGGRRSAALSAAVHCRPCPLAPGAVPGASLAPRACGDPSSHRSPAEGHYAVIQWPISGNQCQSVGNHWAISRHYAVIQWAISGQSVPISRQSLAISGNQ
jgi:hypothetical protein